jgi:hypothetical protein
MKAFSRQDCDGPELKIITIANHGFTEMPNTDRIQLTTKSIPPNDLAQIDMPVRNRQCADSLISAFAYRIGGDCPSGAAHRLLMRPVRGGVNSCLNVLGGKWWRQQRRIVGLVRSVLVLQLRREQLHCLVGLQGCSTGMRSPVYLEACIPTPKANQQ